MQKENKLRLRDLHLKSLPNNIVYIGSAGFEDRALGFLLRAKGESRKFSVCVGINYEPFNNRNRCEEFEKLALDIFQSFCWKTYDRKCPENFEESINQLIFLSSTASQIVIDISGMSKMLIVVILYGLRHTKVPVSIIYAPAEKYYPTRLNFAREKGKAESTDYFPYFLTTDVYKVVTTTKLSSIAMHDAPLVMVAFPNFNHLEISALLNETNSQKLFLIDSVKNLEHNSWRLEAIKWVNRGINKYVSPVTYEIDASDINANIDLLEAIYNEWHLTHKVALSPTGGKLQAVATFCLKVMHPDIHVVYPVVRHFAEEYTEGFTSHKEIFFQDFSEYTHHLDMHRRKSLLQIQQLLSTRTKNSA